MNKVIFILTALISLNFNYAQEVRLDSILNKSSTILKKIKSVSFNSEYKIKRFDDTDTIKYPKLKYDLLKKNNDSILGFLTRIYIPEHKQERIYDGKSFFYLLNSEKILELFEIKEFGISLIKNNIYSQAVPSFLKSNNGMDNFKKQALNYSLEEINNTKMRAWKIVFNFPPKDQITDLKRIVYIDKETLLPIKLEGYATFLDLQEEYFCIDLKNIKVNPDFRDSHFSLNNLSKGYVTKKMKKEILVANQKEIEIDQNFIEFSGINTNGQKIKIDKQVYRNNLLLIDFWHLGCAPCIKAMPELNELYEKYSNSNFNVIGINPFDTPGKTEIINKFILKLGINYQNILVEKELIDLYGVKSFPTLFLFKNGKLLYTKNGYSKQSLIEIEELIIKNIK